MKYNYPPLGGICGKGGRKCLEKILQAKDLGDL